MNVHTLQSREHVASDVGCEAMPEADDSDVVAELARLLSETFPAAGTAGAAVTTDSATAAKLIELQARRLHARRHAWGRDSDLPDGQATAPAAAEPEHEEEPVRDSPSHGEPRRWRPTHQLPSEHDAAALLQTVHIKETLIQQLEAALLMPPPQHGVTVGLSRRVQGLVANARRREAVLAVKLKALGAELNEFRRRERKAVEVNAGLRRRLRDALSDHDAVSLRREVRTLRADLSAALSREQQLQAALLQAHRRIDADAAALQQARERQQTLASDMDYVRQVAVHAMSARAGDALGDGLSQRWRPPPPVF